MVKEKDLIVRQSATPGDDSPMKGAVMLVGNSQGDQSGRGSTFFFEPLKETILKDRQIYIYFLYFIA